LDRSFKILRNVHAPSVKAEINKGVAWIVLFLFGFRVFVPSRDTQVSREEREEAMIDDLKQLSHEEALRCSAAIASPLTDDQWRYVNTTDQNIY
jgi:hypothetical protein